MRTYRPIWEAVKKNKAAKVACSNDHRIRIRKAVIKEKDLDLEFKNKTTNIYRLSVSFGNGFVLFRLTHALKYTPLEEL